MSAVCLEEPKVLSKPTAGKTMMSLLKTQGRLLLEAHSILTAFFKAEQISFWKEIEMSQLLLFRFSDKDDTTIKKEQCSLLSASLILNWVCGRILNEISAQDDLTAAELNFHKTLDICISRRIKPDVTNTIVGYLNDLDVNTLLDILPYIAEVFETGNENAEEKGIGRIRKKANGIFYTPTDVIDFIVTRSIVNHVGERPPIDALKWFDPAVGTGTFLISILKLYSSVNAEFSIENLVSFCDENLFGTDISPIALQSATYLLATFCHSKSQGSNLKNAAKLIGSNLALKDATTVTSKRELYDLFPKIGIEGADLIVSNPPYSKKSKSQLNLFNVENFEHNGVDLYPDFVKMLYELTNDKHGGGGMVVPLSLTASSKEQFKNLRADIYSKDGVVEFLNFDRTPDSLFGDDVKTRNTIVFYTHCNKSEKKISTSYLHRWNSRNRESLFNSITSTSLNKDTNITNGVPKIGDQFGSEIFNSVTNSKFGTLKEVLCRSDLKTELRTKTTAYNWMPVELNSSLQPEDIVGRVFWEVSSNVVSPAIVYSILNSRITYWLWRVWGDGFHLTNQFIYDLPYGHHLLQSVDKGKLENVGHRLWKNVQSELIISKNAGLVSHSYSPRGSSDLIDEIDNVLVDCYGLPNATVSYLRMFVSELIISGRSNEIKTMSKIY